MELTGVVDVIGDAVRCGDGFEGRRGGTRILVCDADSAVHFPHSLCLAFDLSATHHHVSLEDPFFTCFFLGILTTFNADVTASWHVAIAICTITTLDAQQRANRTFTSRGDIAKPVRPSNAIGLQSASLEMIYVASYDLLPQHN